MKKYLLHIVLFFAIVAAVDFCFGQVCEVLSAHARGGIIKEVRRIAKEQEADVVVMGSSRAHHHYVPSVLTDTLGMTAHNAGVDGNGIVLATGLYHLMTERYQPKVIIYDMTTSFDIYEFADDGNDTRYLGFLRPYFADDEVKKIVTRIDPMERYKNYSAMFRYNSKIVDLFKDQVVVAGFRQDGYRPLYGELTEGRVIEPGVRPPVDSLKYQMLEEFVARTKDQNIPLVVILSPFLGVTSSESFAPMREICDRYGIEFWDYYYDPQFQRPDYFKDGSHLNDKGATEFTKVVAERLKCYLGTINL